MDEKEMRDQAEKSYVVTVFDYTFEPVGSRNWSHYWKGFQAACAWMMGQSEPVYQLGQSEGTWEDVSKKDFDECSKIPRALIRILYTAPPMQNTEREIVLPELPELPDSMYSFTAQEFMEDYARDAVLLDRKGKT